MGLPFSSDLMLDGDWFRYLDIYVDYGTEKGYDIEEKNVTASVFEWRKEDGALSADPVSKSSETVPR